MDINTLVKLTNQKLAGETLLYSQLEPYFDDVIDKINTELNAIFPTFSEHRERNQTDSGIPAYTYFPDMYIRSVVVVGAAVGFYTVDEEGIITAQQMQVEYNTNLFMMKRDYSEQVPEQYKATGRGYLTGGNFYVNTDCKQCMSVNNGHCPKTCGITDLFPDLRYVPIQGPPGPTGASVIAVSDTEPTDKACKIWIKAYEDYAEVYTRNSTGAFVYLTKILSKADVDKLQNAVSFDGTITTAEVSSEQCHTNRGVFKILTSSGYSHGGILMAFGSYFNSSTATRQLVIMPTNNGKSMIRFRKYANGVWQPWENIIDTASYAKTSDLDTHINDTNNPHKLTKAALGLGNVDNTADADKVVLSAKKLFNTRKINGVDFNGTKDITVGDDTKIPLTQKGRPNGIATLGSDGLVPSSQLPTYLDDTIKSISANGSAIIPDENKNVNIPLANDTFDGLVTAAEREKLQNSVSFDSKVPVANESFFESIPWKIADGVHKLVEDLSTGIAIGISVYEGILISASHIANVIKLVDTGDTISCYEKYITQTLIYTQSGEKTEIKTRNACITTLQDTGELYEETYGDWKNAFDINGNTIVSESYLNGNGAPTETTVADFVGQMYLDNTNTKLYQCTSITTSETDGTKTYEWIKVIRENDRIGASFVPGIAEVDNIYGLSSRTVTVSGERHEGVLYICKASNAKIDNKSDLYSPIVPANLDYAVRSVRPVASDTAPTTLAVNTLYSINNTSSTSVALTLPQGQNGDFIQYDFVTGTTAPTVTIQSTYGMTKFDFTPEANKIYSLFFDWGIIGNDGTNRYGWRISYAEYDRVVIFPETDL